MQLLLRVDSASAREGLRRTRPSREKKERPWRVGVGVVPVARMRGAGSCHGLASPSAWTVELMRRPMLASPQGASVEKRWMEMLGRRMNGFAGGVDAGDVSRG